MIGAQILQSILMLASVLVSVFVLSACDNAPSPKPSSSSLTTIDLTHDQVITPVMINQDRQKISQDWQYLENAALDVKVAKRHEEWQSVNLPHTWNALDTTDVITGYRRDASWYAKTINLVPDTERRYFLHFEAAQMKASIYVNDEKAGNHIGGYISFDIEITDQLRTGKNEILVRVDNIVDKDLVPSQKADFFQYGGLTRDVWVLTTPRNRLKQVQVSTPEVSADSARVSLKAITDLVDNFTPAGYRTSITSPSGVLVASGEALEFTIKNPELWSPDTPQLYTINTKMLDRHGAVIDTFNDTFGLRWFEFKPNGPFYFNGERLLLRGTHLHEGHAGYGSAMTDAQRIADLTAIKELGANFVRLGHYSHDPVIYDTADKLGIILYDEVPWNRGGVGGEQWRANTQAMTRRMIEQNYNRPSVILWSLGNEMYWLPDVEGGGNKASVAAELQLLHNIAKKMDPGRLTTIRKFPEGADIVDVYSPSIWAGWYGGGYVQYQDAIALARAQHPYLLHMEYGGSSHVGRFLDKPFGRYGTADPENLGSVEEAVNQTGVISVAKSQVWDMSYMIDLFDWYLHISETDPNFAGSAQWAFKDFGTPIRPENPLPFVNMKGLVQRNGIKKDVYHVFASYWQTAPTCWIESPSWNYRVGKKGESKTISVFCNTASAQLSLNNKKLDIKKRDITQYPASGLTWDVVFEEGKNTLAVAGFDAQGRVVAEHGYELTYNTNRIGKMVDIVLSTTDNGDGSLTLFAEAQDKDGNRVVDLNVRGYFTIDGGGRFLKNQGTPTGSQTREFANGTASIIVYPGSTESVVNIQTQDYRGYYITIPAKKTATSKASVLTSGGPYIPDYSYAGYKNGEAQLPEPAGTVFNVFDYGARPNDGLDDTQAVLTAVDAANSHNGPVIVKFPAGRFILSDIIYIERNDFALQGEGDDTTLYYPYPLNTLPTPKAFTELDEYLVKFDKRQREKRNNVDMPFSLYAWSGGFIWTQAPNARGKAYLEEYDDFPVPLTTVTAGAKDTLSILVADSSQVEVGDVVKIEWYNKEGEFGSLLDALYGDRTRFAKLGEHHWNYPDRALVTQMVRITAKNGNQLGLSSPLVMAAREQWQPTIMPWEHLQNVSISDLNIDFPNGIKMPHHVEDGFNGIYLMNLFDSYVNNVTINNADAGIITDDSANVTISDVTTKGDHYAHYTVHMGSVFNVLNDNIRVENTAEHPLSFNTYAVKSVYKNSVVLNMARLDQHSGANHHNLFDNITAHIQLDDNQSSFKVFDGGGAGYWKPSHGRHSTMYNINVQVEGGASGTIIFTGPHDGVELNMIGVHSNREFVIDYGVGTNFEQIGVKPVVPSLYDYQLEQRLHR